MSPLSEQDRRWIRQGAEAAQKLVKVVKMSLPKESEDPEDDEALNLAVQIEEASAQLEAMINWEVQQ